ncbi:MAG: aminotransferase class V-fold PLP-dependent enzyme [Phaeodactylibacter sp.]|uniref:aminotransferase class V-fold PLP-dependent enzyme n=1 Tax=Phaeodactylibacter sp. TaxID=1940289 RepID=UPI0032ED9A3B
MLSSQRHLFDLPDDVAYLNGAYMSPQLRAVETAGIKALQRKSQPFNIQLEDFFEPVQALRSAYARLINCPDPGRIAIIPSVSYGMAAVARNLKLQPGDNIVITREQFPSNYYAWEQVTEASGASIRVVDPPQEFPRGQAWNNALLQAIDERTAMVAMGQVHWADGTLFDLQAIRQRATTVGALLVIDGTQSVGAYPFDVAAIQPDALICAGYKWLMGPYSIGLAYYGPAFDKGFPVEENWINRVDSHDFRNLVNYQPNYQPLAARYNMGEQSNFILVPMMKAGIDQLLEWGTDNIQSYAQALLGDALRELEERGCTIEPEDQRAHHLVGVRLPGGANIERFRERLQEGQVHVSIRGNAIRVSCHLYNEMREVERLMECFEAVTQ